MSHIGPETLQELRDSTRELRRLIPDVYKSFADTHRASLGDGVLDTKTKELIALAVSVSKQCDGCIASHARGAARAGATREEVAEALGVSILMDGGPATIYGPRALEAFDSFAAPASD